MKRYMIRVMLPVGIVALILVVGNRLLLSTSIEETASVDPETTTNAGALPAGDDFEATKEETISSLLDRTQQLDDTVAEAVSALPTEVREAQDGLDPLLNQINSERTGLMAIVSDMHAADEAGWDALQSNAQAQLNTLAKAVDRLQTRVAQIEGSIN